MKLSTTTLFLVLLAALLDLKAQNPLGFALQNGASKVELAFKNESNLMIVPIKVNGMGPFNFILDTGSESGMIFDKLIIGENNLVNARTIPIYAPNGNKVTDIWVANDIDIHFPGVLGVDQSMLVLQDNFVDIENVLGISADGILGSEIFNRFIVEVDYEQKKIALHSPDDFKAPKNFEKIPITIENFRPFVNVKIKQKGEKPLDVKLLIDTGASSALFLDAENNEDINLPEKTLDHVVGRGIAGIINGKIGRLHKLKLGKFKFKKVITSYPTEWRIARKDETTTTQIRYGTIGADVFSRFHVIFNYMDKCIYIKSNKDIREPFRFNTIGMNVMAYGEKLNVYFINDIIPNSPADKAGLLVGDEVIALNGSPAFFYDLTEVNTILKRPQGERLNLIIRREDGELVQVKLKHKRLL